MKETAIIFDHDGTLVNSLEACVLCTNIVMKEAGFREYPAEEIICDMTIATEQRFAFRTGMTDPVKVRQIASDFYKSLHEVGIEYLKIYPGITEALDSLTEAGFSMGMVSNNQGTFVRKAAAMLQYSYDLEIILGEENVKASKPAPDGLLQACAGLGAVPEKSWYVGDSTIDYESARAAGMYSALVTWGAHPAGRLRECGADAVFDTPEQMKEFFLDAGNIQRGSK